MKGNLEIAEVKLGYRPQALDTSIETDIFEFALLRQKSNGDRLQMSAMLTRGARELCFYGLQQTHSHLSEREFAQQLARAFLQVDYPPGFTPTGNPMTWIQDSISLAFQLQNILTDLDIPHYVTGGVAAVAYGEPRTTRNLNIVVSLLSFQVDSLVQRLETEGFYIPGVEDVRTGRLNNLNIIHQETIARADLMLTDSSPFEREKFNRRRSLSIPDRGTLYLASPEDIILNKLLWGYQSQSEKQWRDVLGILKIQSQTLDLSYLNQQAEILGIYPALVQALTEAGI